MQGYDGTTTRLHVNSALILPVPIVPPVVDIPHDPPQCVSPPNRDNDKKWEFQFKLDVPKFYENSNTEEYLDWFTATDHAFNSAKVLLDKKVDLAITKF